MNARSLPRSQRGSALLLAMALVLAIAVIGAAILKIAGKDRVDAGRFGLQDRSRACAEAGIQYGRRLFGGNYSAEHSGNWNKFLSGETEGYGYRPGDAPDLEDRPDEVFGDADGDGETDFWVSIRDDDDERPMGLPDDDPARDNNEVVILRAECTNRQWMVEHASEPNTAVIEVMLAHVQGGSGYGNAQITTNSPDVVGER